MKKRIMFQKLIGAAACFAWIAAIQLDRQPPAAILAVFWVMLLPAVPESALCLPMELAAGEAL